MIMGTMQQPDFLCESETDETPPLRDVFAALLNTDGHGDKVRAITERYRGNSRIHRVDNAIRPPREEKIRSNMYNVHSAPPKKGYTIIIPESKPNPVARPAIAKEKIHKPAIVRLKPVLPLGTFIYTPQCDLTDLCLVQIMEWHMEKEGSYPNAASITPVWIKDKGEWKETSESWVKINQAIKNKQRNTKTEANSIREFKVIHHLHDRPSITDEYLHNVIKWHKEKEGHYPSVQSDTPVWLKDAEDHWSKANDEWHMIQQSMALPSLRSYTSYKSLASFKAAHGYSNSPRSAAITAQPT
jgi:hypothetical protein